MGAIMRRLLCSAFFCFILVFCLISCDESPSKSTGDQAVSGSFALRNCTLIDGTDSGLSAGITIVIEDGWITAVGAASQVTIPDTADVIDLRGAYVLPGFMNMHVHSGYVASNLRAWARAGVTTVRDLGDFDHPPTESFALRDELLTTNHNARLVAAGPLVTTVGGYGNFSVTSPADAEVKINQLIDGGADLIKIAIEDDLQGRTWPMLSLEEIETIVQTAHGRNKLVSAHISRSRHVELAILADVDDLAHMAVDPVPDSLFTQLVEKDIYWVPTLELWDGVRILHGANWDAIAKDNLDRFVTAGGKVALGTDFDGYIFEFQLGMPMLEIQLMQQAGMTHLEIITAATKHAAHVCDRGDELGTVEAGKIADMIILDDNPLDNLDALEDVQMVIHNGEIILGLKK
jgi:imidazolonepropionase-like amidohydrolase